MAAASPDPANANPLLTFMHPFVQPSFAAVYFAMAVSCMCVLFLVLCQHGYRLLTVYGAWCMMYVYDRDMDADRLYGVACYQAAAYFTSARAASDGWFLRCLVRRQ